MLPVCSWQNGEHTRPACSDPRPRGSLDARDEVSSLELKLNAARVDRDNADALTDEITNNVVNSVKGDPAQGENSALYASFGYIRKVDRKSGLTRATNVLPVPTELKAAA